jgi:hypothetical protein
MDTGDPGPQLTHGYWLVAFVDLLGQQEAFCKTDYLPNAEDPARRAAFADEVRASLGVVRTMRSLLDTFRAALANTAIEPGDPLYGLNSEALARIGAMKRRRVREYRWSDGVMLACPLKPEPDHAVPILAVYDILCTCAALMLVQLAMGRPIRGGLDVGTGMEVDGELFGASLVKAYRLESKEAGYPRLLVGQDLVNYLQTSAHAPGLELERHFERMNANGCLGLLAADTDNRWILDYVGAQMRDILRGHLDSATTKMFADARAFAHSSRGKYQRLGPAGQKLFDRYSQLVPYLDARAWLWADTTEATRGEG